jgi:hypothetical protein
MHRIPLSLIACVACCALAISSAPAAGRRANVEAVPAAASGAASSPQATTSHPGSASRRHDRSLTRAARKARKPSKARRLAPAPARAIVDKASNRNFAAAQKAAQAESNARAARLYRASQFSAPIIIDAKACKRIGAQGESIYENC